MFRFLTAAFVAGAMTAVAGHAATVGADTASASSEFSGSYIAENTINGTGLSTTGDPTASHGIYLRGNHWTTARGGVDGAFIEWGNPAPDRLGGLYIWNHRSTTSAGGGVANNTNYEPTLFDLEFRDASDTVLRSFTDQSIAPDTDLAQAFTMTSILAGVSTVKFTVKQVQGTTPFTGLAEVLFDDSVITGPNVTELGASTTPPVPLPAAAWFLLAAIGGLFMARRKA